MFGTYRTLLALIVVFVHFSESTLLQSHYAVFGFFILSGYLMTLIMNNSYGYQPRGIAIYGINRFLRIYPMYWLSCLIAFGILSIIGPKFAGPNAEFAIPATAGQWLQNIALTVRISTKPVLVQPAWSLTVELFYYVCIGLGLSRSRRVTLVWLLASLAYSLYLVVSGSGFGTRVFSIGAATLPFAIGAGLYHWRDMLADRLSIFVLHPAGPAVAFGLFLGNGFLTHYLSGYEVIFYYVNMLLCALIVASLFRRRELALIPRSFDKLMGDLSYPIYLIHAPLGWIMLYLCRLADVPITGPSFYTFSLFVVPTILFAWAMSVLIERPIENVRTRFKKYL